MYERRMARREMIWNKSNWNSKEKVKKRERTEVER